MAQTLEHLQSTKISVHERRAAALFHRHARVLCLILLAVLCLQLRLWWKQGPDTRAYMSIARSIAQGYGPSRLGAPNLVYQPGYAFLITPAFLISDRPYLLLSAFQITIAAAGLYMAWRWARQYTSSGALVVVTLICVNVAFLNGTRRYLSEIPGMALLLLAGLTFRWAISGPHTTVLRQLGSAALAVLVLCAACMTRYVSICLVPGLLLVALLQYYKPRPAASSASARRAAMLAVFGGTCAGALMVAWIIHDRQRTPNGFSNLDYLMRTQSSLLFRFCDTLRMRCCVFGQLAIPGLAYTHTGPGEWINAIYLVFGPAFLLVVWGWWKLVLRTRDVLIAAAPFYFGIYIVWPDDANTRFFMPMLPVIWMCLWRVMGTWRQWRFMLVTVLAIAHLCCALARAAQEQLGEGREWNREYAHLVTLAPQLMPWRQNVAVRAMDGGAPSWLAFELDRGVAELKAAAPIPPRIQAIVQPQDLVLPPGFTRIASSGQFIAARRDVPLPTSQQALDPAPLTMPAD